MEVHEALHQIRTIRAQVTRGETFRGYRAATIAGTGVLGLAAAAAQPWIVPEPTLDVDRYLTLWLAVAVASLTAVIVELATRCLKLDSAWEREQTLRASQQFLPCLVAGGAMTLAIVQFATDSAILLPGLWAIVFSLGVFASQRQLPRTVLIVGVYYLTSGVICLATAHAAPFHPAAMAGTFGLGQLLTAAILYWKLERDHVQEPA